MAKRYLVKFKAWNDFQGNVEGEPRSFGLSLSNDMPLVVKTLAAQIAVQLYYLEAAVLPDSFAFERLSVEVEVWNADLVDEKGEPKNGEEK